LNDAPVAVDDFYRNNEDTILEIDATAGVLSNDTDIDGDTLTAALITGPSHGSFTFNSDGSFTYTPDFNWYGTDSFVYETSDGTLTDTATVSITVNPVNDAPVGVDDEYTIDEDGLLNVPAPGVLVNDYDVDGDSLTAVLVDPPNGSGSFGLNGALNYNPPANWHGVTTLTYKVFDGTEYSGIVTVTITVNSVPDAPVGVDDSYTIDEDTPLDLAAPGLLANDYDVDGDAITLVVITVPTHGSGSIGADGSFSYTPHPNWHGTDTMTYQAFDGTDYSGIVTVTIIVNSVNDAPVAVDDYVVLDEDTSVIIDFMGNDYDVDDTFNWQFVSWDQSEINGKLELVQNYEVEPGVFRTALRYTPDSDWFGSSSSISYGIQDSFGAQATAQIFITVNSVNDAPVADDDAYTINEDSVLQVGVASGVLVNDSDVDGDTLQAILESGPSNGVLALNFDGSFTYTPDADFWGTDSFSYRASDGIDYSSAVTVTITVNPVDDPSVAIDDYVTTDEDTPIIIDVMANDYDHRSPMVVWLW
jgi:VCBS repeat-containing protein